MGKRDKHIFEPPIVRMTDEKGNWTKYFVTYVVVDKKGEYGGRGVEGRVQETKTYRL